MPWIQLLRLRLLPSAICDILCGAALAGQVEWSVLVQLVAGSALLYLSGMVWNDVADAERDRMQGVRRPIALGQVPRGGAAILALLLMATGLWLLSGERTLPLAVAISCGILLYDFLGSRLPILGAPLLGAVRGLNLLLGVIGMGMHPAPQSLWIASLYGVSIALIVWHGALEDLGSERPEAGAWGRALRLLSVPLAPLTALWLPWPGWTLLAASPQVWRLVSTSRREALSLPAGTGLLLRGISRFTAAVSLGTGQWVLAGLCLALAWLVPALLGRIRWS